MSTTPESESFFDYFEKQFDTTITGKRPIPISDFSPIHGLLQYAHDLQGELRGPNVPDSHLVEFGNAAVDLLDERLKTLSPEELSLSFVAIKSIAILDALIDGRRGMYDFGGIHIVNGTPREFLFGKIYDRPTLSLAFEDAEFLSEVPDLQDNPELPSDNLAVPVYSLRLDRD